MIDTFSLLRHAAGDEGVAREVLGLFREHAPAWVAELDKAATLGDLRSGAHRIKGAARGIGAESLAELAAGLERAGELAGTEPERQRLAATVAAVIARIDELLASKAPLAPTYVRAGSL